MPDPSAATTTSPVARPPSDLVPPWLSNLASLAWRVTAVVGLVVVGWFLAGLLWTVTASIAVAMVVSAVFAPVVRLRARGWSRKAAARDRLGRGRCGGLGAHLVLLARPSCRPRVRRAVANGGATTPSRQRSSAWDLPMVWARRRRPRAAAAGDAAGALVTA